MKSETMKSEITNLSELPIFQLHLQLDELDPRLLYRNFNQENL